jgi:hypothetical protein
MAEDDKQGSWWQTFPGIITAFGTLLGALAALIVALNQTGLLHGPSSPPSAISTVSLTPIAPKIVTLPSVIGVPFNDAREVLRSQGFTDIRAVRKFAPAKIPGTVIEQVPKPGSDLPVDQLVNLMIAQREALSSPGPAGPRPEFAGIWKEIPPFAPSSRQRPMWLKLAEDGPMVTVQISYTGSFGEGLDGKAVANGFEAVFTRPQGCAKQFQHSGFNYDHPGSNTFSMRLDGPILLYEARTTWTSPCDGHQIGSETETKRLRRVSG